MAEIQARIMAGIPATNLSLYHKFHFSVGDPAVWIEIQPAGNAETTLILRDIELQRARRSARVDHVACPADFAPEGGLSGDRETATAQSAAEMLRRRDVTLVAADRSLPLIYSHFLQQAGIEVRYDDQLGVTERRSKDQQEIEWLREAQQATEGAMRMACELVCRADVNAEGELTHDGKVLTSERVRAAIDVWLLERGYSNPTSIVACGPQGAICHEYGSGPLRTGQPVIIDIFPQNRKTLYNGDCTRTAVHGDVPETLARMHQAVVEAKAAATQATRAGVTGQSVHEATSEVMARHGYPMGLAPDDYCSMSHGTGHGIGLDVHEPPLLDRGGPQLVAGDALTIEPGLYCRSIGGVRVEDMVIVTDDGCENLNSLPEGLQWK